VDSIYLGQGLRTRDAIKRTSVVVGATLVEPPGRPGSGDGATVRIDEILTPADVAPNAAAVWSGRTVKVSYLRQVFPECPASSLERGRRYVFFCTRIAEAELHALKIMPHSEDAVRVVASAFEGGARHAMGSSPQRPASRQCPE
jgi:hypothetical protein